MTPADAKDWWFAVAALSSALVPATQAQAETAIAVVPEKAGVVSGLKPDARTARGDRVLYVGSDTYRGEKLVTDANGSLHILFMDQSSITLGPNSEITLDEFVYDPAAKRGRIGVSLGSGLMRVVGGQISKTDATTVKTPGGTIGIRGGISIVQSRGEDTSATFLFGQQMVVTDNAGTAQTILRPGFGVSLNAAGFTDTGSPVPSTLLAQQFGGFASQASGGSPPTLPGQGNLLISTADLGGQGQTPPATSLSPDRVSNQLSTTLDANPSGTGLPTPSDIAQDGLRQALATPPATTTS